MWEYVLLILQRRRSRSMLASSGFLLAACALVLLSATTQTTALQTRQIVSKNWRPTYDLVVLPPHTSLPSDKAISPDQFEGYDGGISLQQYEQIKKLSGVEVAAPIAFVSYAYFPTATIQFGPPHPSPGFYQLDWTLTAFNGRQQITEYHNRVRIYASPASCQGYLCEPSISDSQKNALNSMGIDDYFFTRNGGYFTGVPDPGTFLIAAIDPEAENQLVHLDKSIVKGKTLVGENSLSLNQDNPSIAGTSIDEKVPNYDVPLLINTQPSGQFKLQASFVRLATNMTELEQAVSHGETAYLDHQPRQAIFTGIVPIAQNNLQLFSKGTTLVQRGSSLEIQDIGNPSFALNFASSPASLTYQAAIGPTRETGSMYTLVPGTSQPPEDTQGTEVGFRNIKDLPGDMQQIKGTLGYNYQAIFNTIYNGAAYTVQPVGQFDGKQLSAEFANALNWLPENTYTSSPTVLRYDAQGHPVEPKDLLPTTNPAGFILQSPLALTTLTAAHQIRGDNCISVIRVRVAGNVTPDEDGWKRVTKVAQLIQQRTGLRAIVTLGSSPKPTLVYIPGLKSGQFGASQDIDPIGWVEERWIFIGVGLIYLNQSSETQRLLLGAVLSVCLGYLVVTLSSLASSQRRELAVLSALGWRPWQPAGLFLSQALLLALAGGIGGIGLALLITTLIGASPPWPIVAWTLPAVLLLALLSALYPLWHIGRIRPAEVLRAGSTVSSERADGWLAGLAARLPALAGLALRNLLRTRVRSLIALGSLFLSAILLTVMVDGLLAFRQTLEGTLLGNYVLLQTAVPQLAGAAFAVLLTFLSVADLLLLQVRERQREIGLLQAIGWRPLLVQRLFVQEGLTLALVGALSGVLVAVAILLARHATQSVVPLPVVALGSVLLMVVVAALATIPAIRAANRMQLVDVLRTE